ncbi:MAG TPA: TIGR03435 family protein [Bryobacteraceae bacterium]|nr:TIGR03435 family protein [Bryobacteraceae bacterium]
MELRHQVVAACLRSGGRQWGRITVAEALEKQLGLKLDEVPVPSKTLVVESVERKPTENPPEAKEALPAITAPTEFEVADVKLADPNPGPGLPPLFGFRMQAGGRFVAEGLPMRFLVSRAFNVTSNDQIAGLPSWVDSVRVSITAKVAGDYPAVGIAGIDPEFIAPLIRSLLTQRFGLVWHTEQRSGTAYSLVAAKPKLKKADPQSRIYCRNALSGPNPAPNQQVLKCQNATMALFAERLQNIPAINAPVDDATGLDGGWDFLFSFNPVPQMAMMGPGRGVDQTTGQGAPVAADPGGGYTLFESIEKQLGLKLETKKKMVPVTVIDKLNQKPTEN